MKNKIVFRVIEFNHHTAERRLLPDKFNTIAACQKFIDKLNMKAASSPVVYIRTGNLAEFTERKLKQIVAAQAE